MKAFFLTTPTSANKECLDDSVENYWKNQVYFIILDNVIINLKKCFSDESLFVASTINIFFLMNLDDSQIFINHYKAENMVATNCLKNINKDFNLIPTFK